MHVVQLIYVPAEALWGAPTPAQLKAATIRKGVVLATKHFAFRWMARAYQRQVQGIAGGNPRLVAVLQEEIDVLAKWSTEILEPVTLGRVHPSDAAEIVARTERAVLRRIEGAKKLAHGVLGAI